AAGIAIDDDALARHPPKDRLHRRMVPEPRIATDIQPRRITGQPRLGEHDERGAGARGVGGASVRELESALEVGRDLVLDDCDAESGGHRPKSRDWGVGTRDWGLGTGD